MRFNTLGNVMRVLVGILFLAIGLVMLIIAAATQTSVYALAGVALLLVGAVRTYWNVSRMRAVSQHNARQLQTQQMGASGHAPPAEQYPPYQPPQQ